MCGIAGIHLKDRHIGNPNIPVDELVDGLLLNIVKRGHHATGLCVVTKEGKITVFKKDVEAKDFIAMREWLPKDAKTILLHTRYFTQGKPENNENNHPVIYKNCVAVHNGHIGNDAKLFDKYKMHRPAEVDSIAIPMMVHRCGWDKTDEALGELDGPMATAIVNRDHPGDVLLARSYNSPLHYFQDNRFFMFASLQDYILDAWKKNYGTPPDKDKIEELDRYSTLWIKDDAITVGKFRSTVSHSEGIVPAYRGPANIHRGRASEHRHGARMEPVRRQINTAYDRQMYWWDYDAEGAFDPQQSAARIREGNPNVEEVPNVVDVVNCVECGNNHTKMNIKYMKDGTFSQKKVYVWELPVCVRCINDMNLVDYCDSFTYSHQANRSFDFREYTEDEFPEEDLKTFQMGEPWAPAEDGDDTCEICNYFPISLVGRADKLMCRSCFLDEKAQEGKRQLERKAEKTKVLEKGKPVPEHLLPHMGTCDNCARGSVTHISSEGYGVCPGCFALDQKDDTPEFGWCSGCDTRFTKKLLEHTIWGILCPLCVGGNAPTDDMTAQTGDKLKKAVHARACKEAGQDLGYSDKFVNWIVEDCSLAELKEMDMSETYEAIRECYDDAMYVVEWLINEGRHEDLANFPIPSGVWTEALTTKED